MLPFLLTPIGRIAGTLAVVALAWFGFARHYENKGASRVEARIEKRVSEHAKTADDVRRTVSSVAVDRLRDAFTRD